MKEAGKDVQWASFDRPVHGYVFVFTNRMAPTNRVTRRKRRYLHGLF